MSVSTNVVPRVFNPLSRSAMRYAVANGINVFRLGPKQKKWVKALKSGDYNKATGNLCSINSVGNEFHCCLGVACELFLKSDPEIEEVSDYALGNVNGENSSLKVKYKDFDGQEVTLPSEVLLTLDFYNEVGGFSQDWACNFYNEDLNKCESFNEIKRYLEKIKRLEELGFTDLTEMNDGKGDPEDRVYYTHRQIANFIEAYPQVIFQAPV